MNKKNIPLPSLKDYVQLGGVFVGCIGICVIYDLINVKEIKNKCKKNIEHYLNSFKAFR